MCGEDERVYLVWSSGAIDFEHYEKRRKGSSFAR